MYSEPSKPAPHSRRLALAIGALLLLTATATTGCGKKGAPLPPLRNVPMHTTDLQLHQQGRVVVLSMAYPSTTTSGFALGGIDSVELHRLTKPVPESGEPPTAEPREFEADAGLLLTLRGAELNSAIVGDRVEFRLPLADLLPAADADEAKASIFAVRTAKESETSAYSNRITLIAQEPPAPPAGLEVKARARNIELNWQYDGEPEGFDIFRRNAQERVYGKALRRVEGDVHSFKDGRARYGNRYIYTVRTVGGVKPLVHSEPAGEREVDYEDRFPPGLPSNLVALPEKGRVRLRWDPSPASDVAGYILFRRDPGQSDYRRITPDLLEKTEYLDRGLSSGLRFEYRLVVVDQVGNQSKQGQTVAATTR